MDRRKRKEINRTLTTDNNGRYSRRHVGHDTSDCRQMEPEATTVGTKSCSSVVDRCVCSRSDAGDDDDVLFPVRLQEVPYVRLLLIGL